MRFSRASIAAGLLAAAVVSSARADYQISTPTVAPPNAILQTVKSGVVGGNLLPWMSPVDATGVAFGTVANPFALTFGTGVQLPAFAATPAFKMQDGSGNALSSTTGSLNVNCTAGCSGGGGGGNVNITQILGAAPSATNPLWVQPATGASWAVTGTFWPYSLGQQVSGSSVPVVLPAAQITALTPPTTITANAGTNLNTSLLALESGGHLASIDGKVPALGQALAAGSVPVVLTAAQLATLTPPAAITGFALDTTLQTTNTDIGAPGSTACATDTASCSLNQQMQRLAQRLTTINTTLGSPLQAGGSIGNTAFGISGTLPAFAATPTFNLGTLNGAATAANQTAVAGSASGGTAATSSQLAGGIFNTAAPTLTNGQQASLQLDSSGNLKMAGTVTFSNSSIAVTQSTASSLNATVVGTGTFVVQAAQSGTWNAGLTQGGSALSATNGIFTNLLQGNAVLSSTNPLFERITDGTTATVVKAASTAAAATDPALVVAVSPNNTIPLKVASGQVASGAYASGSLASGAVVDLTNLSTPIAPNTATATKGILLGSVFNTTQPTATNAQQLGLQASARGELLVAPGVSGFAVTIAGSQSVNVAQVLGSAISATNGLFSNLLQGNAALSATNPIFSSVTDGTNKAAVKAASTAPVATDPALVVTLSPNSVSNTKVATTRPSFSNATQNPITTGDDGGIVVTDAKSLGPTTVSSATTVFTFATWPYEFVHIDVSGNNGSNWVLECTDGSATVWYPQPLTTDDRTFVTTQSQSGTFFSSMNARLADNQCRVRVSNYGSPDSLTFSAQLRKTGSEPVTATNVQNQVKIQQTRGSADPFLGFGATTTTYYSSSALESGHAIKSGQGAMTQVCASATAAVTLQVFDSATVPTNATPVSPAPVALKQIASGAKGCIPESPGGSANFGFFNGLSVACSTDASIVNKATATSSCFFEVRYQ